MVYLARKQEDPIKGMEYYSKIISNYAKSPFSDSAIMRIALFNFAVGDYRNGIEMFKKLSKSKYTSIKISANYWLNMCYVAIGDTTKIVEKENKFVYAIQIGAFREEKFAIEYMKKFKEEGFEPYILKMDELYKVFIGKFPNKEFAKKEMEKLKEKNYKGFIQYICLP